MELASLEADMNQVKIERDIYDDKKKSLEKHLETSLKDFMDEVNTLILKQDKDDLKKLNANLLDEKKSLEVHNENLKTNVKKLNAEISRTKTRLEQDRIDIEKDLKCEIKQLRKDLGSEIKERIRNCKTPNSQTIQGENNF